MIAATPKLSKRANAELSSAGQEHAAIPPTWSGACSNDSLGAKRAAIWQTMILCAELCYALKVTTCHLKGLSYGLKIGNVVTLQLCPDSFEAADHLL